MGNKVRIISNSKITILPNKKYSILLKRKDYKYSKEINIYAKRISELINTENPFSFNIKIKNGNIIRIKPLDKFNNIIADTMVNK